ncbi:MAG: flavohemoglobin expression-modulating QEGLA motif protein [Dokdonella sp.]
MTRAAIDHEAKASALDQRVLAAVKGVRLLGSTSWPASAQNEFLAHWRQGRAQLPRIDYPRQDHSAVRAELEAVLRTVDIAHPLGDYVRRNAQSWFTATQLIEARGSGALTTFSTVLFGRPGDRLPGGEVSNLDAAHHFINLANELDHEIRIENEEYCIPPAILREELQQQLDAFFGSGVIRVELDPELIAKAAAGANRIRLRSGTCFSEYDRNQLLQHEAYVHSLTALNGRRQLNLPSLGLSSPRITATQEGLAVCAELMTGALDIARIKRISLRIIAIDQALAGADFMQVFSLFLDAGQTESESFASAQRVFRGVPLSGGAAFTKDTVYLHGLLSIHTFFRWALKHQRIDLCRNLFAGKLSLHDVLALQEQFASGFIEPSHWLPRWIAHPNGMAATLAFSLFANRIRLDRIEAEDLILAL